LVSRICKKCKEEYDIENFDKYKSKGKIYIEYRCKKCKSIYNKKYRKLKPPDPEKRKQYYIDNIEKLKLYKLENKALIAQQSKEYRLKNREKLLKYDREYNKINKEIKLKKNNVWNKNRRKNDPSFKLRKLISQSITIALKKNNHRRSDSCLNNLSYTIKELREYLESKFEVWMSWKNHGIYNPTTWDDSDPTTWTWQLDHIIPQSDLPYTSMEDENFKICWSLENLRPYSAKQNLLDGVLRVRHSKEKEE